MIRTMTVEDIPSVQQIDKLCFKAPSLRREELIKATLNNDGKTSLIYFQDGVVVAYIFHHILGSFAWFGTFGVHPGYQGRGIGKELIRETIKLFNDNPKIKNIGIVTMPASCYNLGFYMSLGFVPREMTFRLYKNLSRTQAPLNPLKNYKIHCHDLTSQSSINEAILHCHTLTEDIWTGLDMTSEINVLKESEIGTCLSLYENKVLIGFAILRHKSTFSEDSSCLNIRLLCLSKATSPYTDALESILSYANNYCIDNNIAGISMEINSLNHDICMYLLQNHQFVIEKPSIYLSYGDEDFYSKVKGLLLYRTVV